MSNFDIDKAITRWWRKLQRQKHLEPGMVEELCCSLHDRYEEYLIRGLRPEQAFAKAKEKVMPNPGLASSEFAKVSNTRPWYELHKSSFMFLLPNYLKVALRNLRRKSFYNAINYICLAVGILTTALALLYLDYETSYDSFVSENDYKYRLGRTFRSQDYSVFSFPQYFNTPAETQIQQINSIGDIKGIEYAVQFFTFGLPNYVESNDKKLPTLDLLQTNTPQRFFDFFGWPFIVGTAQDFSKNLNTAVLTESEAVRFFGPEWQQEGIIGKPLKSDTITYTITGVIEDIPPNSHYDFSIALHRPNIQYWGSRTYVKIAANEDPNTIATRMDENIDKINPRLADSELFGGTIMQNIKDIHLQSDMLYELKAPGDARYLYIIGIISGIILLLTISNYTNLSIAMNAGRSREIGMRKIFGASEWQVSNQFVLESLLLSILTLPAVAFGLSLLIPYFNGFMGTGLDEQILQQPWFWGILLGVTVLVGLLASVYPALFLAKHRIVSLFRGNLVKNNTRGITPRKVIITFQFMLLIGLCSLTLFVNQQLRFIQEADIGFDKSGVLYVNLSEDSSKYEAFESELMQLPEVKGVGSGSPLGRNPFNQTTYKLAGTDEVYDDAYDVSLEYDAANFLEIETSVQEYIDNPNEAPRQVIIINETLADKLATRFDLTREELIGKTIIEEPEYTDEETGEVGFPFQIGGTFKDINMFSLREKITPMFLTLYKDPSFVRWASIGYEGATLTEIVDKVKEKYLNLGLDRAFIHSFLSQNVEELYEKERRIARLSILFSLIAFAVAVIGLVALTAYLTTLKRKEIGIRKILGASHLDIIKRFNREYLWLVGIGLLIAAPLTYYGVSSWLSSFAYRIDVNLLIFLLAGLITLIIASVAVSLMTLRVAQSLPVKALQEDQ